MVEPRRQRIVVAEDDTAILELVRTRLDLAGYQTFYARDGYRALETIIATQPAAVVLDINMPGLDGFGVLKALKRDARTSQIPVLMLTARNVKEDVSECLKLGAKDYLTKPFDDRILLSRVARLLRRNTRPVEPAIQQSDPDVFLI